MFRILPSICAQLLFLLDQGVDVGALLFLDGCLKFAEVAHHRSQLGALLAQGSLGLAECGPLLFEQYARFRLFGAHCSCIFMVSSRLTLAIRRISRPVAQFRLRSGNGPSASASGIGPGAGRDAHREAKRPNLENIPVGQDILTRRLAVDPGPGAAAAIANPDTIGAR